MLAANQVQIVFERVDVGSALEGRVAAITESPIAAGELSRNQAFAVWSSGVGGTAAAAQIGAGDSEFVGGAGVVTRRSDVVEEAVVADTCLVDHLGRED